MISYLQNADGDAVPIRTAAVTARSSPPHECVRRTLQSWNVRIDEVLFFGPSPKDEVPS
jgi:5'-nucleotidase